jgi:UDP-N-acetylmuramoylalanine--D-glutamate ligase
MKLSGRLVLVLGLGQSGLAIARHLVREGARVRVADSRQQPPGMAAVQSLAGVELVCGAFSEALLEGVELLAISPGLSPLEPVVQTALARGIKVTGEIELFARALNAIAPRPKLIAITGTNGKTTTTSLMGELCRAAGLETAVAGNISPAALDEYLRRIDAGKPAQAWVLELSSFQLETTETLAADAATVLNVTDDHLDRYDGLDGYADAKARVFDGARAQVLNRQDARVMAMRRDGMRVLSFGLDAPVYRDDFGVVESEGGRWLARGDERLMPREQLPLAGDHNVANALAALALGDAIGLPMPAMLEGLRAFRGLPHRVEKIAEREDGVEFYDDSKGTNVGATLAALEGLGRRVVLIAGGDGKGQDFTPLRDAFAAHARAAILIGRDARQIAEAVAGSGTELVFSNDLPTAVREANARAQQGDVVLLSPACASLDMFRNYAHRAEVFCDAVWMLPGVTRK